MRHWPVIFAMGCSSNARQAAPHATNVAGVHGSPSAVLLGRELALSMSYASYGGSGATASMTAKVVAPQTNPAPLLTLDMHRSVTLGGTTQTFGATQDLPSIPSRSAWITAATPTDRTARF